MNDGASVLEREAALLALDTAYSAFLDAFAAVPDAALSFVPPGEEYCLGILPEHICDPLWSYTSQLDAMLQGDFAPLDLSGGPALQEANARRHAQLAAWRPDASERGEMAARLEAAHRHARSHLAAVDEATFIRTAPVIYHAGDEPLPTSARDIAGWLRDHYDEHTEQTASLLGQWRQATRE